MSEKQIVLCDFDGYDIFRRAIVEQDADAWGECVARYRPLLVAWATASSASARLDECCEDIADQAFARAWSALSPDRFAAFPGLGALLAYLRTCVTAVAIDCIRARSARQRMLQRLDIGPITSPEKVVLDQIDRQELWRVAYAAARNIQELTILVEHFVLDLPPREIRARHPSIFADITTVYNTRRNLISRLQRNPDLHRLYQEVMSA
jgi:DNA-directed RNA polymerase specialized sigma24 family protein